GLAKAAELLRPKFGRFRFTSKSIGFLAPDTLRAKRLDDLAFAEAARDRVELWGQTVANLLEGTVLVSLSQSLFAGPMVRQEIAERFAAAIKLFSDQDYDAAAHVAFPRIESIVRQVAISRNVPALQVGYSSLGNIGYLSGILDALEQVASQPDDRDWWQY